MIQSGNNSNVHPLMMDKHNSAHPPNGILLNYAKKALTRATAWMKQDAE